ncbi:MAG: DNA cytosine methyltransferase, partial [Terriglobia bacterium]
VGLLTSRGGDDLRLIISSLNELGYFCDLLLVDAVHFVPQSRPRLFIFGSRVVGNQEFLKEPHPSRPAPVVEFVRRHQALKWGFVSLPALPASRSRLADIVERPSSEDPAWWNTERQNHLYGQMSPLHKRTLEQLTKLRHSTFATVYKRVRPAGCRAEVRADGIAGCLRTPRGGSSKQFLIQAGYGAWRVRNMTAREYARLQGVPDSFRIDVPYNQALFGLGDAVCIPAVEWVVRSCMGFTKTHRAGAA